jgi:multidrug resistance efflux pump
VDIPRPPQKKYKKFIFPGLGVLAIVLLTVGVSNLDTRAPTVVRATQWIDSVRRGELLREVNGNGTLVPENPVWISSVTPGRVEAILVQPGAMVKPNTVLIILSNPDIQRERLEAERQLGLAEAGLIDLRSSLESQLLSQESNVTSAYNTYSEAKRQFTFDERMKAEGVIAVLDYDRSKERLEEAKKRFEVAEKQLEIFKASVPSRLNSQQAQIDRARDIAKFQRERVEAMNVVAGAEGQLTEMKLEIGQWVGGGQGTIGKVVVPGRLKAVIRIQDAQAKDLAVGQKATIDTRNGIVPGHVTRIDPASTGGSIGVDIALDGPLPAGARPDINVDGRIEIERLPDVLQIGRPVIGQAESVIELFKLTPDGKEAHRVRVGLGKVSVNLVEIRSGLAKGDLVILSDMAQYDGRDKVRIQ